MRLWWVLAACAGEPAVPTPPPLPVQEAPVPLSEAERHTENLRFRDNRTVFEASASWLVAHPDEALPVLVSRLDAGAPESVGILLVLPQVPGRDGVDALSRALARGDEILAGYAATALARHPDPASRGALETAAGSGDAIVRNAALRGLGERGDAAACPVLVSSLAHPDADTRYYAARSALALECLDAAAREALASDASEQVRGLVRAP